MPTATEQDFEEELLRCWKESAARGYRANRFYQQFMPHCKRYIGGVEAARRAIRRAPTSGTAFASKSGYWQITVENLVIQPQFENLFNDEDRRIAFATLQELKRIAN